MDSSEGEGRGIEGLGSGGGGDVRGREREERESLGWITGQSSRSGGGGKEEAGGAFDLSRGRRQSVHPLSYNGVLSRE